MANWNLQQIGKYIHDFREYEKKRPNELKSILRNLDRYFAALPKVVNTRQIRAGYIHVEPHGIVAIDQKGGGKKIRLQETRLYLYPDAEKKTVYLMAIGNKKTQKRDIADCSKLLKQLRKIKERKDD